MNSTHTEYNMPIHANNYMFWEEYNYKTKEYKIKVKSIHSDNTPYELNNIITHADNAYLLNLDWQDPYYVLTFRSDTYHLFVLLDTTFSVVVKHIDPHLPNIQYEYTTFITDKQTWFNKSFNNQPRIVTVWKNTKDSCLYVKENQRIVNVIHMDNTNTYNTIYDIFIQDSIIYIISQEDVIHLTAIDMINKKTTHYTIELNTHVENMTARFYQQVLYAHICFYNPKLHMNTNCLISIPFNTSKQTYDMSDMTFHLDDMNTDYNSEYIFADNRVYRLVTTYEQPQDDTIDFTQTDEQDDDFTQTDEDLITYLFNSYETIAHRAYNYIKDTVMNSFIVNNKYDNTIYVYDPINGRLITRITNGYNPCVSDNKTNIQISYIRNNTDDEYNRIETSFIDYKE